MANIRGIELASEIYDLEDTSARNTATAASQTATQAGQTATQASQTATQAGQTATQANQTATQADEKIGTLANLITTVKTNLVAAINELVERINDLFGSSNAVEISPGIFFKKVGNTVFVRIATSTAYWPQSADLLLDGDGNVIVIPENLRPQNNVNTFIADNNLDTLYRLRLDTAGHFISWDMRYSEQTFALPIGQTGSNWQASFSYQLGSF